MPTTDTIIDLLATRAEEDGDARFVTFRDADGLTLADTVDLARRYGSGLRRLGVERGDAVAMLLGNAPPAVLLWFACSAIGAVDAQLNGQLRGEMLARQVNDTGATVVIVDAGLVPVVLDVEDELPLVRTLVVAGGLGAAPRPARLQVVALDDLVGEPVDPSPGDERAITTVVYTGGTTGVSKGCAISHAYALSVARRFTRSTGLTAADVTWTPLPMYHVNAKLTTVLSSLVSGAPTAFSPRFSVSNFWRDVGESGATRARIISTMIPLIADGPDAAEVAWAERLQHVIGSPVSEHAARRFRERWDVTAWSPGYGLTELLWVTAPDAPGQPIPPDTLGRVADDMAVRLVDDRGHEVAVGEVGEITVRPRDPGLMFSGYWRNPEATWMACRDLWFATGDLARRDADGRHYFVDRKKDALRRKGENVACAEVEEVLRSHPLIDDAAVVGVPAALAEDDILAWVVVAPDAALTPGDLFQWCETALPKYAIPRYLKLVDALPRQEFGRVLKNVIRDEGEVGAWDSEGDRD